MNKKIIYNVIFVQIVIFLLSCSEKEQRILATVNRHSITVENFRNELGIYRFSGKTSKISPNDPKFYEIKKDVLNSLIRERILVDEAVKRNLTVNPDEIDSKVKEVRKNYPGNSFRDQLLQNGINFDYWKSKAGNLLLIKKLTAEITKNVSDITEKEIKEFYDRNIDNFKIPERIRALQIVVKTEEDAYKIYKAIRKGKKFEDLAMEHSITPEAKNGGDLGYFSQGSLPKIFEDNLFKLKEGRISKVVKSEYGYHILKVTDKKPKSIRPLEEVKNTIKKILTTSKKDKVFSEWLKEVITKTKIQRNNSLLANIR